MIFCAVLSSDLSSVVLIRDRGILKLPQGQGFGSAAAARIYADACGTFAAGSAWRYSAGLFRQYELSAQLFALRAPSRWFDGTSLSGAVRYNEAICYDGYPTFAEVTELPSMEVRGEVPPCTWWYVATAIASLIGNETVTVSLSQLSLPTAYEPFRVKAPSRRSA